jgi:demethylmenaquinone methyltransferase/2-methoxy-6-polyprenyl-1,4-benzoquinol methylase
LPQNFTALLAAFWWSHIPRQDIGKFLESLCHFMPADSLVLFIDNRYVEGSSIPISSTDTAGNTFQTRKLSDGSSRQVLKNFPSAKELLEAVRPGFEEASVTELDYFWFLKCKTKK